MLRDILLRLQSYDCIKAQSLHTLLIRERKLTSCRCVDKEAAVVVEARPAEGEEEAVVDIVVVEASLRAVEEEAAVAAVDIVVVEASLEEVEEVEDTEVGGSEVVAGTRKTPCSGMLALSYRNLSTNTPARPPGPVPAPDAAVTKAENALVASKAVSLQSLSLSGPSLPRRPGHGTMGNKVILRANYFHLLPKPNQSLYKYSVDLIPATTIERKRRLVIQHLLKSQFFTALGNKVASDYSSIIITTEKLKLGPGDSKEQELKYRELDDDPDSPPRAVAVRVQLTRTISLPQLVDYLGTADASSIYDNKEETIQALNIIMARMANTAPDVAPRPRRNKYFLLRSPNNEIMRLGAGLIALRGFYASVRTSTLRLLLNVNPCVAAFYQPGPLPALIDAYLQDRDNTLAGLARFLRRLRVETNYLKNKKGKPMAKVKTIRGLATDPKNGNANDVKFHWDELGRVVSIKEYFTRRKFDPIQGL